jgi:hypothetical protein
MKDGADRNVGAKRAVKRRTIKKPSGWLVPGWMPDRVRIRICYGVQTSNPPLSQKDLLAVANIERLPL